VLLDWTRRRETDEKISRQNRVLKKKSLKEMEKPQDVLLDKLIR